MEKKHELPEFQVIIQNEANAKFFVASGPDPKWGTQNFQISNQQGVHRATAYADDGDVIGGDSVW